MKKKIFSTAFAAAITSSLVIIPTVVPVFTIAPNAVAARIPVQPIITKIKEVVRIACEWGVCWEIAERVVEYYQAPSNTSDAPNCSLNAKGCTTPTGGRSVKIGETRTIIRKVRIR